MTTAEITRLLALRRQGRSHREIAAILFYTHRTIALALYQYAPELADIGLRNGRRTTRPERARALRQTGITLAAVAEQAPYCDGATAQRAVKRLRAWEAGHD